MKKMTLFLLLLLSAFFAFNCSDDDNNTTDPENSDDVCHDKKDNDGDGAIDCDDAECNPFCESEDTEPVLEWRTTWVASQQLTETQNNPPDPPGLAENTLRQTIHITAGGEQIRFTISNENGTTPLTITSAAAALSLGDGKIDPDTSHPLTFGGEESVTIEKGDLATSDAVEWEVDPFEDIAISLRFDAEPPVRVTGHPGSRTYSYLQEGDAVFDEEMPDAARRDRWYFISSADVMTDEATRAVVTFGDSITDGYGTTTDGNDRWPDHLARRLHDNEATKNVAVLNQGVGGNCLTATCAGPAGDLRFDRDVLKPLGVEWVIILIGINDLGNISSITTEQMTDAYTEMAESAHTKDIMVIGGTIMPCEGHSYYDEELETIRQEVNEWIRTTDVMDAVIDFDEIMRDPEAETKLQADLSNDWLHPSKDGYEYMADAVDLTLFEAE